MALLDGKALAKKVRRQIKEQIRARADAGQRIPRLDVALVGEDPASQVYVGAKEKDCVKVGMGSAVHRLPADTGAEELLALVARTNADRDVDGLIVQLPLPGHIDERAVIAAIHPDKDVDGFHPINGGRLLAGEGGLVPCTPLGCTMLIDETGVDLKGKAAVVIGRSNIVGKPMALMLLARHATVTICHSRTADLAARVAAADVVVAAVGRPEMVKGEWIKPGAVVIDVGVNRLEDGRLVGDVEFEPAAERASWITPVPGGVGPMTRACLLANTMRACELRERR